MSAEPRFLVVDGYTAAGREDLEAGGASTAGLLYQRMLKRWAPEGHVDIVYPADPGVSLPTGAALRDYDGLAWTGSSLTIWKENDPNVVPQIELMKEAFRLGVPSFGSCWAAQIGAVAAGGRCVAHPWGREMGIARKIRLTDAGRGHPMYTGIIVFTLGVGLAYANPVTVMSSLAFTVFFMAKTGHEEEHLIRDVPGYRQYRSDVPWRLIPYVM